MSVGTLAPEVMRASLAGAGLALRIPPITVRLRSPLQFLADQIHALYRDYDWLAADAYADIDIRMLPVGGLRRWGAAQVQFIVDEGNEPAIREMIQGDFISPGSRLRLVLRYA